MHWNQAVVSPERAKEHYLLDGYIAINHYLRTGQIPQAEKEIYQLEDALIQETIDLLTKLARPLGKETELWRGMRWQEKHAVRHFVEQGFCSTSQGWETAYQFATTRSQNWEAPVIMRVIAPANTMVIDGLDAEAELILLPGAMFSKFGHVENFNDISLLNYRLSSASSSPS